MATLYNPGDPMYKVSRGRLEATLLGAGATNSQDGNLEVIVMKADIFNGTNGAWGMGSTSGAATEDSTGALNFVITAQFSNNSAFDEITVSNSYVELIA